MNRINIFKLKAGCNVQKLGVLLLFVLCFINQSNGLSIQRNVRTMMKSNLHTTASSEKSSMILFSSSDGPKTGEGKDSQSTEMNTVIGTTREGESIQGYLSSDISKMESGKQVRVLLYISLALLPCLLLIPFFMNRDFVPPIDADMMK